MFPDIIESEKIDSGRSQGSSLLHRLVTDPKHIGKAVRRDSSLEDLPTYDRLRETSP